MDSNNNSINNSLELNSNNSTNDDKISKTTGVYLDPTSGPPYTAGVPVLEIIRRLEDEKSLTRHDRIALKEAIHDSSRREKVLKALRDVELGSNKRFALRRLKALLHQNGGGEPSNKSLLEAQVHALQKDPNLSTSLYGQFHLFNHNSNKSFSGLLDVTPETSLRRKLSQSIEASKDNPIPNVIETLEKEDENDDIEESTDDLLSTITKVVGNSSNYANTGTENICSKISARLNEFLMEYQKSKMGSRKFAVIVGEGSFNPLTRMHMRTYFLAKQELESRYGYVILGSLLSPAHGVTVRERYRVNTNEIIPSPHRLTIAQLIVQDSKWLTIDPWAITRRRPMDYISLLDHANEILKNNFNDIEIKLVYLCKANFIPKLSADSLKTKGYNCVCVCRSPDTENLRVTLGSKWNNLIYLVEDNAILDNSIDIVTSRKVRDKIKAGETIDNLVGDVVSNYVNNQRIGLKMNGIEEWNEEEKSLPKLASRVPFSCNSPQVNSTKIDLSTVIPLENSEATTSTSLTNSEADNNSGKHVVLLPNILPRKSLSNITIDQTYVLPNNSNDNVNVNTTISTHTSPKNPLVLSIPEDSVLESQPSGKLSPSNESTGFLSTLRNISNVLKRQSSSSSSVMTPTSPSNDSTSSSSWLSRKSIRGSISFLPSIISNINNNTSSSNINNNNNTANGTPFTKRPSFKISLKNTTSSSNINTNNS